MTIKPYKENGTITVLKDLKFKTLNMVFKGKIRENVCNIDLDKL